MKELVWFVFGPLRFSLQRFRRSAYQTERDGLFPRVTHLNHVGKTMSHRVGSNIARARARVTDVRTERPNLSPGTRPYMKEYANDLAKQLPVVQTKKELQKLLGCFNQLRPYVPSVPSKVRDFHFLCQAKNVNWGDVEVQARRVIGECVVESQVPSFGHTMTEYKLFTDWSREGLGFCLSTDG